LPNSQTLTSSGPKGTLKESKAAGGISWKSSSLELFSTFFLSSSIRRLDEMLPWKFGKQTMALSLPNKFIKNQ